MEIGLKERLIGAVVLVILAVIIIPWVLSGGSSSTGTVTTPLALPQAGSATPPQAYRMELDGTSPPTPLRMNAATAVPPPAATTEAARPVVTGAGPAITTHAVAPIPVRAALPRPKPRALPEKTPTSVVGHWVIQAGSYSDLGNAQRVERKLAQRGLHAFISHFSLRGRVYYRVRVGPYADRADAEHVAMSVARAYGGRAEVVPN